MSTPKKKKVFLTLAQQAKLRRAASRPGADLIALAASYDVSLGTVRKYARQSTGITRTRTGSDREAQLVKLGVMVQQVNELAHPLGYRVTLAKERGHD